MKKDFTDRRPWRDVLLDQGFGRAVRVAHAAMNGTGRDSRWPPGSAMNAIPPVRTESNNPVDRIRERLERREDNNA